MLLPKPTHAGLSKTTRLFGLDPLSALLLFPGLFVGVVVLHAPLLAAVVTLVTAAGFRALEWGKLPGFPRTLALYLLLREHHPALGYDPAPLYPVEGHRRQP